MLLIIDLETITAPDGEQYPCEVGLVAYDPSHRTIVGCFSTLIYAVPNDDVNIHRIPNNAIQGRGIWEPRKVIPLDEILKLTNIFSRNDFDYVVAHNSQFEEQFIQTGMLWLCTYRDFDLFPPNYNGKRDLISLAQWHGVGVSVTHRAIYDCLLLAEVFNRVDDLRGELQYALLPKVEWLAPKTEEHPPAGFKWDYTLQGWVGKQTEGIGGSLFAEVGDRVEIHVVGDGQRTPYDFRESAKQWGFCWDGDRKVWHRLANPQAVSHFPFPTKIAQ